MMVSFNKNIQGLKAPASETKVTLQQSLIAIFRSIFDNISLMKYLAPYSAYI